MGVKTGSIWAATIVALFIAARFRENRRPYSVVFVIPHDSALPPPAACDLALRPS
jgi:hypothetical protein